MLIGLQSGPEDSVAGWYIAQNSTAQTLYFWYNASGQPTCFVSSVALPGRFCYTNMCWREPDALFPDYLRSYTLGGLSVSVFKQQASGNSTVSVLDDTGEIVSLSIPNTPFDSGALVIDVEAGSAIAPPWLPPSYCP